MLFFSDKKYNKSTTLIRVIIRTIELSGKAITWFEAAIDENHTKVIIMRHRKIYRFSIKAVSNYNTPYNRDSPWLVESGRKIGTAPRKTGVFFLFLLILVTLRLPSYEALRPLKRFPVSRLNLLKRAPVSEWNNFFFHCHRSGDSHDLLGVVFVAWGVSSIQF